MEDFNIRWISRTPPDTVLDRVLILIVSGISVCRVVVGRPSINKNLVDPGPVPKVVLVKRKANRTLNIRVWCISFLRLAPVERNPRRGSLDRMGIVRTLVSVKVGPIVHPCTVRMDCIEDDTIIANQNEETNQVNGKRLLNPVDTDISIFL